MRKYTIVYLLLFGLLILAVIISLMIGAVEIKFINLFSIMMDGLGFGTDAMIDPVEKGLFLQIRLPRVLLGIMVGAVLSVSGTLMQALFRNPIVEPGLIGTSSGAALGAAAIFVFGKYLTTFTESVIASFILPLSAFAGALTATLIVYFIASSKNRVNVATMILAGVAVNALAISGTGYLSYIARDPQARSITFWNLGSLSGADWNSFYFVAIVAILSILYISRHAKSLNAILLGESEAAYLGINTERLKLEVIIINTLMVAIATSVVGVIGFIGLVVPHLLRLLKTSDNRFLIYGSALLGATVLTLTDLIARIIIAPAELPIGIITSLIGAPFFIWMLIRQKKSDEKGGFYA